MEKLFSLISVTVYGVQAFTALWGVFCVVLAWRRIAQTRFRDAEEQHGFLGDLRTALQSGGVAEAVGLCGRDRRALPQLALYAFTNFKLGMTSLRQRVVEHFERDVLSDLEYLLSWINTVIKTATMLGLLGTVIGMMGAFEHLSSGEQVDAKRLARDIYFALITTFIGLSVAIPLIMCASSIQVHIRKMQDLLDAGLNQLFEILGEYEASRATAPKRGFG